MHTSLLNRRPAVRAVFLVAFGIALSLVIHPSISGMAAQFCVVACLATLLRFLIRRKSFDVAMLHLLLVLLGFIIGNLRRAQILDDILGPKYLGERVFIRGRVESEPVRHGTRSDLTILAECIRRGTMERSTDRMILVQIVRRARWLNPDSLGIGDRIELAGYLEPMPGARNPGEFDYGRYLALNGIQGFVSVRDTNSIILIQRSGWLTFAELSARAQSRIYHVFDEFDGPEQSSFLKGVVFGYRGDLSAEVKQAFMDTGTIHILAVSGSNVVVVALIFYSLIGFLRVSSRVATGLALIGLLWYMVMTGLSPSVIRATIMAGVVLLGTVAGRRGDVYNSLAVAALAMLLWDPLFILDVGFQLSFAAVLSIVYFYPKLEPFIRLLPASITSIRLVDGTLKLFAVSVAAQIGTLPFSAYYFGQVSLISIVANLVVVPASGLNTLLGFATLGASYVSGWLSSCYSALNDLLVALLLKFVIWCAHLPYATVETMGTGALFAVVYYAGAAALCNLHKPKMRFAAMCLILVTLNVDVFWQLFTQPATVLSLTAIDVGQGDGLLIELPGRRSFLVDTGPNVGPDDAGHRTIVPFLRRKGIRKLEAIVLTHPHDDHVGGCASIMRSLTVGSLIVADTAGVSLIFKEVLATAHERGVPVKIVHAGERLQFDPSTRIFVLQPEHEYRGGDLNNQSLVVKLCYGDRTMLLTGDAGTEVEHKLEFVCKDLLSSDVLKVGHHGSSTSSSDSFLRNVHPSVALISVGKLNKFKHPSRFVISRLRNLGIEIHRTDLEGAIIVQTDGRSLWKQAWRSSWLL